MKRIDTHMIINTANEGYVIQRTQHQGRKCIVVPVIMMMEGVHNGSAGAILHRIEDLGMFPESWNGIPVVIDHPEEDGQNISANAPSIIDGQTVGRVYNTHVNGNRLMAEIWLDEEKIRQLSPVALAAIINNEPLEVSVGVFSEDEQVQGDWNGEQYEAIAKSHRPDHLALLPGGVGACSWADGCGVRANNEKKGGKNMKTEEDVKARKAVNIQSIIENNVEQGYRELVQLAQRKIDSMDSSFVVHYLQEVYDTHLIYEVSMHAGGSKLFKQNYEHSEGKIELNGNPVEVTKKVEYVPIIQNHMKRTKFNNVDKNKEVKTMSDEKKCTPCIEAKVKGLIANKQTKYTEADEEWLKTMDEEQLDKMVPEEVKPEVPIVDNKDKVEPEKKKPEVINALSDEDKADLAWAKAERKLKRDNLIKGIKANTEDGIWSDDILKTMSEDTLGRIFASASKEEELANYALNSDEKLNTNVATEEALYPAGIEMETETK